MIEFIEAMVLEEPGLWRVEMAVRRGVVIGASRGLVRYWQAPRIGVPPNMTTYVGVWILSTDNTSTHAQPLTPSHDFLLHILEKGIVTYWYKKMLVLFGLSFPLHCQT